MLRQGLLIALMTAALSACTHGDCKTKTSVQSKLPAGEVSMDNINSKERVRVYKPDGSLQCGQGKPIKPTEMQKDLKDIKVYSAVNKNDGMIRIQMCGAPTGNCNVFEIGREDLDAALKLGFKEWTFE